MRSNQLMPHKNDLFHALEQDFNLFFDNFFGSAKNRLSAKSASFPKMSAFEKDGEFVVMAAVSGMTADDVQVEVTPDNELVLRGRMSEAYRTPQDARYYFSELRSSAFERRMMLPDNIEGDPKATMKDGVLALRWRLNVPQPAVPEVKRIAIVSE